MECSHFWQPMFEAVGEGLGEEVGVWCFRCGEERVSEEFFADAEQRRLMSSRATAGRSMLNWRGRRA